MHPLPVPGSHEYVMRTAGSVDQSVAPETTASGSQGRLIFQSPHGRRSGQSTPRNTEVVGGVYKSWVVCTSRGWCVQVVGGVYKSWVVCTSRGLSVEVSSVVWKS